MAILISDDQIKIRKACTFEQYISGLVAYCNQNFPHLSKTISDKKRLRQLLKDCDTQAEDSGFTLKGPSQFYIGMLLVYGIGLKTDPQYPWFRKIMAQYAQNLSNI